MSPVKLKCHWIIEDVNKLFLIYLNQIFSWLLGTFIKILFYIFPFYWKEVLYFVRPGMCWQERVVRWLLAEVLFAFIYCGDMEDLYQVQGSHQQCWHWFSRHRYTIMFFITFSILSSLENYGEILAKKTIILGKWKIPHVDSLKLLF